MGSEGWPSLSYFNSRPCERGDPQRGWCFQSSAYFNSRPCERGDADIAAIKADKVTISIHAPARGATQRRVRREIRPGDFNSRPCERGDVCGCILLYNVRYFNSRPCERGDTLLTVR